MSVSKVISIEVTDPVTRVSEMSYNSKNPVIYKSVIFNNPQYSVEDGLITDRPAFEEEFRNQIANAGIKCKDAVFVLSSNKIISREITIPDMKKELIEDLIENERGEYFPMDTSEHVFSHNILEHIKENKQIRVNVFAAPEILVKNYTAVAAELDLKLVALDYSGNTVYQWMLKNAPEPLYMYLHINEKNSLFTILDDGKFSLQRNMNFGTSILVNDLLNEGYYDKNLTEDEALLKLRDEALLYPTYAEMENADPGDENEAKLHELKRRLTADVRPLVANISRVLEYFNTKNREAKVSKIYVGGIGSKINGLKELIESEFNGIEIIPVSDIAGIRTSKKNQVGQERATELVALFGASLPTINFYKGNEKKKLAGTMIFCFVALGAVIAAAVIIVLNGKAQYNDAVSKQNKLQTQQAVLESSGIEQLEAESTSISEAIVSVEEMDRSTFNYNENWNDIMKSLEEEGLKNMIISSISSTPTGLTMNVTVGSKEEAAKFLLQLQHIPHFKSVQINGISEVENEETMTTTVSFSVLCEYNIEGEGVSEGEVAGQ